MQSRRSRLGTLLSNYTHMASYGVTAIRITSSLMPTTMHGLWTSAADVWRDSLTRNSQGQVAEICAISNPFSGSGSCIRWGRDGDESWTKST